MRLLAALFALFVFFAGSADAGIRAHGQLSGYPAWVVLSGTEAAYNLAAAHPGPIGTLRTPAAYCIAIGGCTGGLSNNTGNSTFDVTSTHSIDRFDSTGVGFFCTGGATVCTLTNIIFKSLNNGYIFQPLQNSGGVDNPSLGASADHFLADGINTSPDSHEAYFITGVGTYSNGTFQNAARDMFDTFLPGWTISGSYFSMWGQTEDYPAHSELGHIRSSGTFSGNYVNADDGHGATGGQTGTLFADSSAAGSGAIILNVNQSILTGNDTQYSTNTSTGLPVLGIGPALVCKAIQDVTFNVGNVAISPAVTGTQQFTQLNIIGRLNYTVTSGGFTPGEKIIGGTSGAFATYDSTESVPSTALIIVPFTSGTHWDGHFVSGEVVTGQNSGKTATLTAVAQGNCTVNDLGGNVNKNTNLPVDLTQHYGF